MCSSDLFRFWFRPAEHSRLLLAALRAPGGGGRRPPVRGGPPKASRAGCEGPGGEIGSRSRRHPAEGQLGSRPPAERAPRPRYVTVDLHLLALLERGSRRMVDPDLGSAVDGLLSLAAAPARRAADPRGKAVVEGSTSVPPVTDPASRRRPRPATTPEPLNTEPAPRAESLKTEPASRARAGQPSAAKKQRVAPRVTG